MGKNKMIAKSCPKCDLQVAVASKTCKCGHTFFSTRKTQEIGRSQSPTEESIQRRTSRVRRGKPQYYDSQEYVKKNKRKSPRKGSQIDQSYNQYRDKETVAARKRRALRRSQKEKPSANSSNGSSNGSAPKIKQLKPSQLARCSIILNEINRKMFSVTCRPGS